MIGPKKGWDALSRVQSIHKDVWVYQTARAMIYYSGSEEDTNSVLDDDTILSQQRT